MDIFFKDANGINVKRALIAENGPLLSYVINGGTYYAYNNAHLKTNL